MIWAESRREGVLENWIRKLEGHSAYNRWHFGTFVPRIELSGGATFRHRLVRNDKSHPSQPAQTWHISIKARLISPSTAATWLIIIWELDAEWVNWLAFVLWCSALGWYCLNKSQMGGYSHVTQLLEFLSKKNHSCGSLGLFWLKWAIVSSLFKIGIDGLFLAICRWTVSVFYFPDNW